MRTEPVQLALRQIAAAGEEKVRARSLRRDPGKEVGGEQQQEGEQRRRHAEPDADVEEHTEERQQVRRLTDEQIVEQDVGDDEQ